MIPKGKLIAVGGAEDKGTDLERGFIQRNNLKFFELGILKAIVNTIGSKDARIEVVTTASSIPDEVGQNYLDAFAKIGCTNVGHINIRNRDDAHSEDYMQRLKVCDALMFSGGNQMRLTSIFGGTDFLDVLRERYEQEDFVIAGTSAGAMAMSRTMIYEGNASQAHLKGEVKLTSGLGFVEDLIIDSHFDKRGRFPRLAQAVIANPSAVGIGLCEDTGVIITNGFELEATGSGAVFILDGRNIRRSNIADIDEGSPISAEGLIVHIMEMGDRYNFKTKKLDANDILVRPAE
jgi:cyanophycinase